MDYRNLARLGQCTGFVLLTVIHLLFAPLVRAGCVATQSTVDLDIPAGELGRAATLIHQQAHVAFAYNFNIPPSTVVRAVKGNLTLCEALERMLAGTGLSFDIGDPKKVFVYYDAHRTAPDPTPETPREGPGSADVQVPDERPPPTGTSDLAEVLVTGSFIRGVDANTSPLFIVGSEELNDQSPYATLQDALRNLPMNFGGGAREIFDPQGGVGVTGNFNGGESVNLLGLGDGATLVLVDGVRQPTAGLVGNFIDISTIPLSAIDHVEILPDGASALYGSDAIAGVVNIILRKELDGGQSQFRIGGAEGGARETVADQLFGTHWDTGRVLVGYQFSNRTSLAVSARAYSASTNQTPFGGTDYRSDDSNPGNVLDPQTQLPVAAIPRGSDGSLLNPANLLPNVVNLQNQDKGADLLPDRTMHALYAIGSQQIGDGIELFAESRLSLQDMSRRYPAFSQVLVVPASNAFNPFKAAPYTLVGYSFFDDFGTVDPTGSVLTVTGATGLRVKLAGGWRGILTVSYGRNHTVTDLSNEVDPTALANALADGKSATAFNAFGDGSFTNSQTLAAIREVDRFRTISDIGGVDFVADGSLIELPTGEARMAAGAAFRREDLDRFSYVAGESTSGRYDRTIASLYSELAVPLLAALPGRGATPALELSLAAREDRYSDVGSTLNPKLGLRWAPASGLKVRGGWSTSFRAPGLLDLYDTGNNASGLLLAADPHSATGQSLALVEQGNNTNLRNETATTWSLGVDYAPRSVGLTLSLNYFQTRYRDRIFTPGAPLTLAQILSDPQWSPLVTRAPASAQVAAICNSPTFLEPASQCTTTPPAVIIDARITNLSATTVNGLEWQAEEAFEALSGHINLRVQGSSIFNYRQQVTPVAPDASLLDTVGNPLALRVHAMAGWSQHGVEGPGFGVIASVDYANAYRDVTAVPYRSVGSWTVTSLEASYRFEDRGTWTDDLRISMNATNLFNRSPPYVDREIGFDAANAQPLGRVSSLQVRKDF